jgi:hypothetical protein
MEGWKGSLFQGITLYRGRPGYSLEEVWYEEALVAYIYLNNLGGSGR